MTLTNNRKIIAVVDDDPDDLELLCEAFYELDPSITIHSASSGNQFIEVMKKTADDNIIPSLVVVDYNMPDLNGADVIASLTKDKRFTEVPIIVWSTSDSPLYRQKCMNSGADHYFRKPHTYPEIVALTQEMVKLAEQGKRPAN